VLVQTASGSASAEMTIEGLKEFEAVRDFLYGRMRGVKQMSPAASAMSAAATAGADAELAVTLREIAVELRGIRAALTPPSPQDPTRTDHV
jgi:putative membrane protein